MSCPFPCSSSKLEGWVHLICSQPGSELCCSFNLIQFPTGFRCLVSSLPSAGLRIWASEGVQVFLYALPKAAGFPNHGLSHFALQPRCQAHWRTVHSSDVWGPGVPALLLTASGGVLSPFPHFRGQLPCTWARSLLPPGRPLSALWSQPLTYCPWTWWRPVLRSVIGGYRLALWLELLGVLIFHVVSHSHYNFLTSLVGFSLPSTVDLSSSCWLILLWFGGQEWQSFYFLYHNQKQVP